MPPLRDAHQHMPRRARPTKYASEVGVCQIDLMRRIGLEEYRKDHSAESATKLDSLTVGINPR